MKKHINLIITFGIVFSFMCMTVHVSALSLGKNIPGWCNVEEDVENEEKTSFEVEDVFSNVTADLPPEIYEGDTLRTIFIPDAGFHLPDSIAVKMGEKHLLSSDFLYSALSGEFQLDNITGNVEIEVNAVKNIYHIQTELDHLSVEQLPDSILHGDSIRLVLKPAIGYGLPATVNIKMAEIELQSDSYTYNPADGSLLIPDVGGDVLLEAKGVLLKSVYSVSGQLTHIALSDTVKSYIGEAFSVVLNPDEGFRLPDGIRVTMKGEDLPSSDYVYEKESGDLRIEVVTGDIVICAEGVRIYSVKTDLSNVTLSDIPSSVDENATLRGRLVVEEGFELPNKITVLMGDSELSPFLYSYSPATGVIEIGNITGDVEITAFGVGKVITRTAEEITSESIKVVWNMPAKLDKYVVRIYEGGRDGVLLFENEEEPGICEYTFLKLKSETDYYIEISALRDRKEVVRIEVEARTLKSSVANETISGDKPLFKVSEGKICFLSSQEAPVSIYNLSGACVFNDRIVEGTTVSLSGGLYILVINDKKYKFLI